MGTIVSSSAERTHALGVRLGRLLEPDDFIGLSGELGAGKTALVRGICEGAGVDVSEVSSPTFNIVQTYSGRVIVNHVDLYRLTSAEDLYATGFFDLEGVSLVEWIDRIPSAAPMELLRIALTVIDATQRRLELDAVGPRAKRLLEELLKS